MKDSSDVMCFLMADGLFRVDKPQPSTLRTNTSAWNSTIH